MTFVICEPCVGVKNGICATVCPVDCIYEAGEQKLINPAECIDCGACAEVCPVSAIFFREEVPAEWTSYIEKNRAFFQ